MEQEPPEDYYKLSSEVDDSNEDSEVIENDQMIEDEKVLEVRPRL
jgi:hypothetical protein